MPHFVYDTNGDVETKRCKMCVEDKPLIEFTKNSKGKHGVGSYCVSCESKRKKAYYVKNKQRHAKNCRNWTEANREKIRRIADEKKTRVDALKDKPCMDCGQSFPPYVMDFDHRNPATKSFNIGRGFSRKWATIEAEIAKCDLVCSNCHRIRTFSNLQSQKLPRAA